ncbi:MAG: hypothetical protein ACFE9I_12975 [Candidatus Hermodarchaeota archaeon]
MPRKLAACCLYLKCGGFMKYHSAIKQVVCQSCGLSLSRHELDMYWQKVRNENISDVDQVQKQKNRRKEWLEWFSSSKSDKENY